MNNRIREAIEMYNSTRVEQNLPKLKHKQLATMVINDRDISMSWKQQMFSKWVLCKEDVPLRYATRIADILGVPLSFIAGGEPETIFIKESVLSKLLFEAFTHGLAAKNTDAYDAGREFKVNYNFSNIVNKCSDLIVLNVHQELKVVPSK